MRDVSAVIPVHNGAAYVAEAVESALRQTLPPREVLVVDDGSTDDTPAALAAFGERIRVLRTPNRGVGAARNAGCRAAAGAFVAFLDADDRWLPDKLAAFAGAAARHPSAGLAYSDALSVDAAGRPRRIISGRPRRAESFFAALLAGNVVTTSSAVVRRAAWAAAGGFREDFACKAGVEDWEFFLRVARLEAALYIPRALTAYRVHAASAIQTKRLLLEEDALRVVELHGGDAPPAVRRRARAYVYFSSGVRHLAAGDGPSARRSLARSLGGGFLLRGGLLWLLSLAGGGVLRRIVEARRARVRAPFPTERGGGDAVLYPLAGT